MDCLRREPKNFFAHLILGWAYERKQMFPEALSELREADQLTHDAPLALASFGEALAESGDRRAAADVVRQLEERAKSKYVSAYDIGMIYAALGDHDRAFQWLARAEHDRASFLPYITWDRRADSLRSDARFTSLLQRMGLNATQSATLMRSDMPVW